MPVQDIDRGWNKIMREVRSLDGAGVKVGILSDAVAEPDGADMVTVAAVQEFGSPEHNIPARPFLRTTADRTGPLLQAVVDPAYQAVLAGGSARDFLYTVGAWYQGQMQVTLTVGPWAPNAPATIARKKSDRPLIDKGHLRSQVRFEVFKPGTE